MQKYRLFNSGWMEKKELLKIIDGCEPKNLYITDETGLFEEQSSFH